MRSGSQFAMHLRSIVLYLSRKLPSAKVTHGDVVATLGLDAVSYTTMTRRPRKVTFVSAIEEFLNPRPRRIVTKLITPFCWPLSNVPLFQCETYRDWLASLEIRCIGDWWHRLALLCVIFDKCCMFCQTRRSELKLTRLASYCSCSRSRMSRYGMTSWSSMSPGFIYQLTMSSSDFQPVRRSSTERGTWFSFPN
jgi:hypothetical protein